MVGHGGSSAGSYLANPTFPIPSHCASVVMTSTLRVNALWSLMWWWVTTVEWSKFHWLTQINYSSLLCCSICLWHSWSLGALHLQWLHTLGSMLWFRLYFLVCAQIVSVAWHIRITFTGQLGQFGQQQRSTTNVESRLMLYSGTWSQEEYSVSWNTPCSSHNLQITKPDPKPPGIVRLMFVAYNQCDFPTWICGGVYS